MERKKGKNMKKINYSIKNEQDKKPHKILNIVLIVIAAIALIVSVDLFCVSKLKIGPFFAIRTYNKNGSKQYYGLGYKVIKYNEKEGRKGTVVGFWTLPFITEATEISTLDLALSYGNDAVKTYKRYYQQYLKVTGTIDTVDNQGKIITLKYDDPDGKYTMNIIFHMNETDKDLSMYTNGDTISIAAVLTSYKNKMGEQPAELIFSNGFIKE